MSEGGQDRPAFGQKSAEIAVAALFLLLGAIVIYDSVRLGARWVEEGPQAGYFPFYIAVFVCVSSAINLALAFPELGAAPRQQLLVACFETLER